MSEGGRKGGCISATMLVMLSSALMLVSAVSAPVEAQGSVDTEIPDFLERSTAMSFSGEGSPTLPCLLPEGDVYTTMLEYQGYLYIGSASASNHPYIYRYDPTTGICISWQDAGVYYVYSSGKYGGVAFWGNRGTRRATTGPLLYFDGTTFGSIPGNVWFSSSGLSGWIEDFEVFNGRLYASGTICTSTPENTNYFFVKYCDNAPCRSSSDWHWTDTSRENIGRLDDGVDLEEFNGDLYLATYDSPSVLRYYTSNNTWWHSLSGDLDGNTKGMVGGYGIFGLVNYSGSLHALTYRYGWHWMTQDGETWTGTNLSFEILTRAFVFEDRIYLGASDDNGHYIITYDGQSWSIYAVGYTHFRYFATFGNTMYTTSGRLAYQPSGTPYAGATVDCSPDTLNPKSKGKWITCYIELPSGYDPRDIDVNTILVNDVLSPELDPKYGFVKDAESYIMDHDGDGIEERMVKFDRGLVLSMLEVGDSVELVITGELVDTTSFGGSDSVRLAEESQHHQ